MPTNHKGKTVNHLKVLVQIATIATPFIITIGMFFLIYQSINYQDKFEIDFSKNGIKKKSETFFLNESQIDKFEINSNGYTSLVGSPIDLRVKPIHFPYKKDIKITGWFKGDGNWDITLNCDNCPDDQEPETRTFYYSELKSYNLIAKSNLNDIYIYNKNTSTPSSVEKTDDIIDWIEKNIESDKSVSIIDKSIPLKNIINNNVKYKKDGWSEINNIFRGDHSFYVYLGDSLNLEILKEDLNWQNGSDEVAIELFDINGEKVLSEELADDNVVSREASTDNFPEQIVGRYNIKLPHSGLYKLDIRGIQNNHDWIIGNIKINTNKIITTGPVFLLNAGKLYTKPTATSQVEIFSMYNNYQTINIKGDKHDYQIEIDSQNINKWNNIVIAPDDYHIESNGGQKINGLNFSVSQESYFNPFIFRLQEKPESKKENLPADIIITKYEITNDQDGWTKVSQQYNQDVIMANGGYESINFRLTSAKIGASYWTKSNLENNGLELRNNLGNYNLWAKPEMPELVDKDLPVINNNQELISFLDKTLPKNTHKVIASSANIKDLDYINKEKPNGFNNQDKSYPISLRGEHTFFIYLKNKLDLSFIKEDLDLYSGLDSIEMTLTNWLGEKVCSKRFIDSENKKENLITFSCPNIETGPYILDILELLSGNKKYNDFLIRNLKVNTNKLMIKDRVLTMKPIKLITNYTQNQEISFYYWHKNKNQEIIINNNETNDRINLTKEDMGKYVPYTLSDGKSIIEITIGDLYIRNNKSALDEDSWFEATHDIIINSRVNQNTEYAAIPIEENKNTILKKLEIEIK